RHWRTLGQLAGQRPGVVEGLALLGEPVREPETVALRGWDLGAEDQVLEGEPTADQARVALGAAEARRDAQVGFGLTHPRGLLEDADVATHRDLAAAPESVAVDRGHHRLREALDPAHHAVAEANERAPVRALESGAEIGPRAEDLVARSGDDHAADRVVVLEIGEGRVQLTHQGLADRVGGR